MQLTFELDDTTHAILVRHLPHGTRKKIYRLIMQGFAQMLEENRNETLAAVVEASWDLKIVLRAAENVRSGD